MPEPPLLLSVSASPPSATLHQSGEWFDLQVIGHYRGGWTSNLTARATFASDNLPVASVNGAGWDALRRQRSVAGLAQTGG